MAFEIRKRHPRLRFVFRMAMVGGLVAAALLARMPPRSRSAFCSEPDRPGYLSCEQALERAAPLLPALGRQVRTGEVFATFSWARVGSRERLIRVWSVSYSPPPGSSVLFGPRRSGLAVEVDARTGALVGPLAVL